MFVLGRGRHGLVGMTGQLGVGIGVAAGDKIPREGGVETLAGFLLMQLGHIPEEGESVVFEGRRLTVTAMDARRIARVRVEPIAGDEPLVDPTRAGN